MSKTNENGNVKISGFSESRFLNLQFHMFGVWLLVKVILKLHPAIQKWAHTWTK